MGATTEVKELLEKAACNNYNVMAGLVPAIHVFCCKKKDVDARHKAGHDGLRAMRRA
jgi:hypothetical protein